MIDGRAWCNLVPAWDVTCLVTSEFNIWHLEAMPTGRSPVRFPMESPDFFSDLILPVAL